MKLKVRARTADYNDGQVDEIADTVNASRKSFYFDTTVDRYYEGMRLRINFPYDPACTLADPEHIGEVVRVDRKDQGYGVAVALGTRASTPAPSPMKAVPENRKPVRERRVHQRAAMIASAELMDLRTGVLTHARTSDLSLSGCYIDTLNPLPLGTAVELWIKKGEEVLEARAVVCVTHHGCGMGLKFEDITPEHRTRLSAWISEPASLYCR
jgi:hypothetical protein